jgi:hypothetical protein
MIGARTPAIFLDPAEVARRARELDMAPSFGVLVAAARRRRPELRDWSYTSQDGARLTVSLTVTAIDRPGVSRPGSSASRAT